MPDSTSTIQINSLTAAINTCRYTSFMTAVFARTTSCKQTKFKQDSNQLTVQSERAWYVIHLERYVQ